MEKLTVRIRDEDLGAMVKKLASANQTSVNSYIVQLIARDAELYKKKIKNLPILQRGIND